MNALSAVSGEILRLRVATENRKYTIFGKSSRRYAQNDNLAGERRVWRFHDEPAIVLL